MNKFSIIEMVLSAGAIHGFVLSFAIFKTRLKHGHAWFFLCSYVMVFSTGIAFYLFSHFLNLRFEHHPYIIMLLFLLMSPLIYLYIRSVTGCDTAGSLFLHFIPFSIMLVVTVLMHIYATIDLCIMKAITITYYAVITIQFIIYFRLSFKALKQHGSSIRMIYSSIEKYRLIWLRFLLVGYVVAMLLGGMTDLMEDCFRNDLEWHIYWLYISCVVYAIGYRGLHQPEIWKISPDDRTEPRKKYEKTEIPPARFIEYGKRLQDAMDKEYFLDPEISMPLLAKHINIPMHHLSQLINKNGINFYELINSRRTEYAKRRIENGDEPINIARIAFDSGFNSLSAFNNSFKKYCRMTPSEWKKLTQSDK